MAFSLELSINGTVRPVGRYVSWSPAPASLRVADSGGVVAPIRVTLRNSAAASGGKLEFRLERKDPPADELDLVLPDDGTGREFFLAGRFGSPSTVDGDALLEVHQQGADGALLASLPLMVRIRKDAERLTAAERSRFLLALARLNDQGRGLYQSYRDAHREISLGEAHGLDGFLPWHRAYLLDLERELQILDPSVALPYWRFDQPSPGLFTADFFGASDPVSGLVQFAPSNPLRLWSIDGLPGINRTPSFDPATSPAHDASGQQVRPDAVITGFRDTYSKLRPGFEGNPHGTAHLSFTGPIHVPATAPRDPLFFLLHCNVDRLWATWQWLQQRFDSSSSATYGFRGRFGDPGSTRIGHNLLDTMWPWNGVTGGPGPRPPTAPRTPFPETLAPAPGNAPTVQSMIDFQGLHDAASELGFDYDDVPYQPDVP